MDWVKQFRLDPTFFNQNDKFKEISRLIQNHNYLLDDVAERREAKISHILDEEYEDPLAFLNSVIDIIENKFEKVLDGPTSIVHYFDENNQLQQKWCKVETYPFKSLKELDDFLSEKKKIGYKIYPFTIFPDFKNKTILFRGTLFTI